MRDDEARAAAAIPCEEKGGKTIELSVFSDGH
jgi:hypothetical protein